MISLFKRTETRLVEVVIARYAENDFDAILKLIPTTFLITIYNKGDNDIVLPDSGHTVRIYKLPNVGKCDHTYLHHIIENYESKSLAGVTLFMVASVMDNTVFSKTKKFSTVLEAVKRTNTSAFPSEAPYSRVGVDDYDFQKNNYLSTNKKNQTKNPEHALKFSPSRPFGKWFKTVFKNLKTPESTLITWNGIFAVDRDHIHQRPISLYKKLIKYVDDHSNPEAGHYLERAWTSVFHPLPSSSFYRIKVKKVDPAVVGDA